MQVIDLKKKYPNIMEKVREWDSNWNDTIKRLEEEEKKGTLEKWI